MKSLISILYILFTSTMLGQSDPIVSGAYFGLSKPGLEAVVFAEGIISRGKIVHCAPAFSPDDNIVLWCEVERDKPARLLEMRKMNGVWSEPAAPSFADPERDDFYPRFAVNGKALYFSSRRPLPAGYPPLKDMAIWVVKRNHQKWGVPRPLIGTLGDGEEYAHSVTSDGSMYFSFRKDGGKIFDIGFAGKNGNTYDEPIVLPAPINTTSTEDGPYIAPDESYLIFESDRPGGLGGNDLYICFKKDDGSWNDPLNMGPKVNTVHSERFAGVSPDGNVLFFGSDRNGQADIYWIDAGVIDLLRPANK